MAAPAGGGPLPMGPPGTRWGYDQLANEPPTPSQLNSQSTLEPLVGGGGSPAMHPAHRMNTDSTEDAGGAWACDGAGEAAAAAARTRKSGWLAPAALLLVALFVQNTGLYLGTRCYVRWMDELAAPARGGAEEREESSSRVLAASPAAEERRAACSEGDNVKCPGSDDVYCSGDQCCPAADDGSSFPCPSASPSFGKCGKPKVADCLPAEVAGAGKHEGGHEGGGGGGGARRRGGGAEGSLQAALTLDDALARLFRALGSSEDQRAKENTWGAEFSVDLMTSLVSVLWLGWVVRAHDLRLWTKALLSGSVLAALKGFLAWATVLPDAAGWQGCQERLGPDGLTYFRELSSGGVGGGVSASQAFQDIVLLEIRGLWMMGRASRRHVCADTVFSVPTCFCVLFAVCLYDAVRSSARSFEANRRATVLALAGTLLVLVFLVDFALMVSSPHHYTVDVAIALPLTLMVYGSPAVAVCAEWWASYSEESGEATSACYAPATEGAACSSGAGPSGGTAGAGAAAALRDLGLAVVPPCCVPFCSIGGQYYLREEPGSCVRRPWNADSQKHHERQVAEFAQIRERNGGRARQLEDTLEEERRRSQARAGVADAQVDKKIQAKESLLQTQEAKTIAEAQKRLEEELEAKKNADEKAAPELARLAAAATELLAARARLQAEAEAARREAEEARAELEARQAPLPRLHGELGPAAAAVAAAAAAGVK